MITVRLSKLNWEIRKLSAVLIATLGVIVVVYGDSGQSNSPPADHRKTVRVAVKPKAPLVGDLLTLCASFGYGLYQVMYKRHAALPSDQEFELSSVYVPLPDSDGLPSSELSEEGLKVDDLAYPPPFGLHPNFIAFGIGLSTLFSLWVMLPILHYSGFERFRLPDSPIVFLSIAGIAGSGIVFNVGLLVTVLLLWLPFPRLIDFPLSDAIGHLGTRCCLCRQPPYDRSRTPIRYDCGTRHGRNYPLEFSRLCWDRCSIWHLGL